MYKIFISHTWSASNAYYPGLIRLLDQANKSDIGLSVPNIHQLDSDKIGCRGWILKALKAADAVLVVNTPADLANPFVQSELRLAERHDIPIVAINPPKRHGQTKPSEFTAIARAYSARWTSQNIVDTIKIAVSEKPRASKVQELPMHYAYQSVAVAAAGEPLTLLELEAVRGDDDARISPVPLTATAKGELPRDVMFSPRENSIAHASALLPLLVRPSLLFRSRPVRN